MAIVDKTGKFTAKINNLGQLNTLSTEAPPRAPFTIASTVSQDGAAIVELQGGSSTVALTGIRYVNRTSVDTTLLLYEWSAPDANSCSVGAYTDFNFLGYFLVPAHDMFAEDFTSPVVLQPLSVNGPKWCLVAWGYGDNGPGIDATYNGYVASGSLPSLTASPQPAPRSPGSPRHHG